MKDETYICILCPLGCAATVKVQNDKIIDILGCECKKGQKYIRKEHLSPERVLTSSVRLTGGQLPLVSVRTARPIPKSAVFSCMAHIRRLRVKAPVAKGDTITDDLAGTGVALIATKTVKAN